MSIKVELEVKNYYGTRFYSGDTETTMGDNFKAYHNGSPVMAISYLVGSGGGHGEGRYNLKNYKFVNLVTMKTIENVTSITVNVVTP